MGKITVKITAMKYLIKLKLKFTRVRTEHVKMRTRKSTKSDHILYTKKYKLTLLMVELSTKIGMVML